MTKAEVSKVYDAYHNAVNMTHAELKRWNQDPCSLRASLDRGPIERNLHLLSTPKSQWGEQEVDWAKRTVSFIARMKANKQGHPVAKGCPSKRDISLKNWAYNPARMKANRSRPRVYDAEEIARNYRETFAARPVEMQVELPFEWPAIMQNVGDSLAVAYASDKWEKKRADGSRFVELYKHLAESRNQALALPGLLRDEDDPDRQVQTYGPLVSLESVPMPQHFAVLGLFEEASLELHTSMNAGRPRFSGGDGGVVRVEVRHGMLGASKLLWSKKRKAAQDQPFLFVYTEQDGVMMIIIGERLDVERDGIVG